MAITNNIKGSLESANNYIQENLRVKIQIKMKDFLRKLMEQKREFINKTIRDFIQTQIEAYSIAELVQHTKQTFIPETIWKPIVQKRISIEKTIEKAGGQNQTRRQKRRPKNNRTRRKIGGSITELFKNAIYKCLKSKQQDIEDVLLKIAVSQSFPKLVTNYFQEFTSKHIFENETLNVTATHKLEEVLQNLKINEKVKFDEMLNSTQLHSKTKAKIKTYLESKSEPDS